MGEKVRMPTLTDAVLRWTITRGETSTGEIKKAVPRPGERAERMCGMANAQGGIIIIGVENKLTKYGHFIPFVVVYLSMNLSVYTPDR